MSGKPDREQPRIPRRYTRPRSYVSWFGLLLGLLLGIGGGLFYAWVIDEVKEVNTEPWQLRKADRQQYIVAIMLAYSYDSDLNKAVARLVDLKLPGDFIQAVADTACELATTGYVDSTSGLRAVRAMMTFYHLQGKVGCADNLIPAERIEPTNIVEIVMPTSTLIPPPTKTPTPELPDRPTPTPVVIVVPTSPPQSDFVLVRVETFCDLELSGMIEVNVVNFNAQGLPGQEVRVRWDGGEDRFVTGLKPERGPGYADFAMEAGKGYIVDMPGRSAPTGDPLTAVRCTTETGVDAIISYRVVFREG